MILSLAHIVRSTEAEGPGKRFAIWFQGCPLRCPGCCNPEMLTFEGGQQIELTNVLQQIESSAIEYQNEGITLLGGEPFAHANGACLLAEKTQQLGLSVMIFSGFTLTELQSRRDTSVDRLLQATDILVDGPYLREQPDSTRRWIGSRNQQIHFLSSRYRADDPCWQHPNTLEIRLQNGQLQVNGFPAKSAKSIWKRPTQLARPASNEQQSDPKNPS